MGTVNNDLALIEDFIPGPTNRSYWVVEGRLAAGAYPGKKGHRDLERVPEVITELLGAGIDRFVNLTEDEPGGGDGHLTRYDRYVEGVAVIDRHPIVDVSIPTVEEMVGTLDAIDGYLTEGPGYNMFIVRDGKVSTPDSNILEGVTRRSVRAICETENIPYEERKVHPDELQVVDEIFCSTTAGGVMPVTQLDSQPIGNGHKGLLTSRIQEKYWRKREAGWRGTRIEDILRG